MLKGFKEFLLRGNVIDLAIAVVIGTAFVAIVKAFSDNIIDPLIAAIGGSGSIGLGFQLISDNPKTFVDIGAVITAAINFALIAAVVYFALVVPVAAMNKRRKTAGEETLSDTDLLTEIRDLLAAGANTCRHGS
ncbi:large conductance mechanosensitive channel protein MscL [Antrihabitans cavernicola]|uniref:Large-conductance mechanosensitive channel n=1 Tax=Antrihabitans cavernicola TaxID=2495913 RepID=A0A5A7SD01_9NOCA|nr:large conductance mechanosensitive channel protein MscL [Spelaeibacter cavernicola]KAA0023786.1 large conductance mechanosensitive channel protein MscL [Spelaeibacter cavernicola]